MDSAQNLIERIFSLRTSQGCWKTLGPEHPRYPEYQHYVPTYRATLWTLIELAELGADTGDPRAVQPLEMIQDQFFDEEFGIYSLGKDHLPIPCLNGNMMYLEAYFKGALGDRSLSAVEFFNRWQRFDDGAYAAERNRFCANKSCYGPHSCFWGIVKLYKGISFIPKGSRPPAAVELLGRCRDFILLHQVCFSSHHPERLLTKDIGKLAFPSFYKSDVLEILWLLAREGIPADRTACCGRALELLWSKRNNDGTWDLEREHKNMTVSLGSAGKPNAFVTSKASSVFDMLGWPELGPV